jgi:hypothetical protein
MLIEVQHLVLVSRLKLEYWITSIFAENSIGISNN